jgi:hypothetical protein
MVVGLQIESDGAQEGSRRRRKVRILVAADQPDLAAAVDR